jgi:hypothetical protein
VEGSLNQGRGGARGPQNPPVGLHPDQRRQAQKETKLFVGLAQDQSVKKQKSKSREARYLGTHI